MSCITIDVHLAAVCAVRLTRGPAPCIATSVSERSRTTVGDPASTVGSTSRSAARKSASRKRETSLAIKIGCFALVDPFSLLDHQLDRIRDWGFQYADV